MNFEISDITVIITCFKEGPLIYNALQSLENQTILGFEILIINDCSPDIETNDICKKLELDNKYSVYFRKENGGLSGARNTGFELMKGKIAVPLDADDTLPLNAIEDILNTFNKNDDIDMVFGDYNLIKENSVEIVSCQSLLDLNVLSFSKLASNWILMGQSPCKKELWKNNGGYLDKFKNTTQDVDFWRRACLLGFKGSYTNSIIYNWNRSENGMNNSVKESDYLLLRIDSLPFYDKYNPEYVIKIRDYIYRYYSSRLMYNELNEFVQNNTQYFSSKDKMKVVLMRNKLFYKFIRKTKNIFKK